MVFDGEAKTMTSTRCYPFGRIKAKAIPLSNLALPELVWIKDADSLDGGDWHLRITFADGRRFDHRPLAHTTSGQQRAAETLRDNITALM